MQGTCSVVISIRKSPKSSNTGSGDFCCCTIAGCNIPTAARSTRTPKSGALDSTLAPTVGCGSAWISLEIPSAEFATRVRVPWQRRRSQLPPHLDWPPGPPSISTPLEVEELLVDPPVVQAMSGDLSSRIPFDQGSPDRPAAGISDDCFSALLRGARPERASWRD